MLRWHSPAGNTPTSCSWTCGCRRRLPWLIGVVVGLSVLLLMVVFRSVTIAIKAAVMNLLSISAAYGVLTAVAQWG